MALVRLDGRLMLDWPAFHRESQRIFGFPDFYGHNLDAWIDCLSGLRNHDGMSSFALAPDETLEIELVDASLLKSRAPHILEALEECIEAVNERHIENGEKPVLHLHLRGIS